MYEINAMALAYLHALLFVNKVACEYKFNSFRSLIIDFNTSIAGMV